MQECYIYSYPFYTIALRNFVVPTRSVVKRMWFTETHLILIISFLLVLLTQFILDIK